VDLIVLEAGHRTPGVVVVFHRAVGVWFGFNERRKFTEPLIYKISQWRVSGNYNNQIFKVYDKGGEDA